MATKLVERCGLSLIVLIRRNFSSKSKEFKLPSSTTRVIKRRDKTEKAEIEDVPVSLPYTKSGDVNLPSVTRILSASMPPEQREILDKWEKSMIKKLGEDGFKEYKSNLFSNGKELHENIRSILTGTQEDDLQFGDGIKGHWRSLRHVVLDTKKVSVLESFVVHPKLQYCGIVDCVGMYKDKLVLIDWKTAEKPKPVITMTYDTPLQIAAYIGAMKADPNYNKRKVKEGLIVVGYQNGQRGESFFLSESDIAMYWKKWNARLNIYRKQQNETESNKAP